tara:strand:- start:7057 stop:7503 length:447 start_codon:yes stop_codon:yes gene_type:complete
MAKFRKGEPWLPASEYAKQFSGIGVNLLVSDMQKAIIFHEEVLNVEVVYSDTDFTALKGYGSEWMLHADHTYDNHPLLTQVSLDQGRGKGIELRLHGCDPDEAQENAKRLGFTILTEVNDKNHGLREVYIFDQDGYIWVPDIPVSRKL